MYDEYIELYNTYTQKYGSKTAIFLMVGSFYELYDIINTETGETKCNVREITDILGIQLSSKKKDFGKNHDGLFAGFPDYVMHKWAGRLTSIGWTVIVVDQVKDTKGKVKERKVSRILSPSTHIENIQNNETPYIMTFYFQGVSNQAPNFGAAILDLTTGTTHTYLGKANGRPDIWTADDLVQMISVFQPKEVLVYWKADIPIEESYFKRVFGLQNTPIHIRNLNKNYTDNFCRLIATINDAAGGNVLGSVQACATVLPTAQVYNGQPYFARSYSISATSDGPSTITLYLTQDDFDDYNAIAGTFPTINANTSVGSVSFCVAQVPQTALPGAPGVNTIEFAATATWNAAASRWEVILPTAVTNAGYYFHACNPFNTPLPVNITRFDGHKGTSTDILEWTTSSEQNNAYFNLQHSTDGVNFTTLAKVNSKAIGGNSNTDLNYSTINPKPVLGHNYYRLQQVDLDGHTSYETRIVDLIWGAEGSSVSIYPNPATNVLNIDYLSNESINTHVKILDMSGRTVKQVLVKSQAGMNSINIDIAALADGIYTVQIFENNNLSFVQKVRKNN
jgi:hypothetical protein